MPWPWSDDKKKPAFQQAPNSPVVSEKSKTPPKQKPLRDLIDGKRRKKTRDEIIAEMGG